MTMATKDTGTTGPHGQTDYIEHGSQEHAGLLGLRKAAKEDNLELNSWTLEDMTAYGPQATMDFLKEVLRQKVSELTGPAPKVPDNAPPMWEPVVESNN